MSSPPRDPSPGSSQGSSVVELEIQWTQEVVDALRDKHSLESFLDAPTISGPTAPIWMDIRVSEYDMVVASPGNNPNEKFPPATEEDVTEDELMFIKKFAERSFLAYCPERIIKDLEKSNEVVTNENLGMKDASGQTRKEFFIIPQNKVKITKTHYSKMWTKSAFGITGIAAVVLVDEIAGEIVVSVRGTMGLMNWLTDAAIFVISARQLCKGCYMHSGFWVAAHEIQGTVKAEIMRLRALDAYKDFSLAITGHSLGGAVAYLLRAHFAVDGDLCKYPSIDLVTFGQPKAGNRELATWAEKLPGKYLRVTHSDDLFVSMPASFGWTSFGTGYYYVHTRNEYHIKAFPDPSCTDIQVDAWKTTHLKKMVSSEWFYKGGAHKVGRYGLPLPTKLSPISSHSLYLYRTNICNTKPPKIKRPPTTDLKDAKPPDWDELMAEFGVDTTTWPNSGIISDGWKEWDSVRASASSQSQGRMSDVD